VEYADAQAEMGPYTTAFAKKHGWIWHIPLFDRIGSGYVFCNDYCSEDEALAEFEEHWKGSHRFRFQPSLIRFESSRMNCPFQKNVVCIGLSAGFIEPLEANSIYTIQFGVECLSWLLRKAPVVEERHAVIYNKAMARLFDYIVSYIHPHYSLTQRNDSAFWRYQQTNGETHKSADRIWNEYRIRRIRRTYLSDYAWLAMAIGMKVRPRNIELRCNPALTAKARVVFDYIRGSARAHLDWLPSHFEYLKTIVHA